MRPARTLADVGAALVVAVAPRVARAQAAPPRGIELADLTWVEADKVLTPDAIVVIPLGAQSKEHGPHLRLDNDFVMAGYLTRRVLAASNVVVAPTVNYHFYPAFLE